MAWILPVQAMFDKLIWVMEAITFVEFIEEEAIQTCSLGAFLALKAKNYKAASWCIIELRTNLVYHLRVINDTIGWMAPYSHGAFSDFVRASELNLEVYDEILMSASKK